MQLDLDAADQRNDIFAIKLHLVARRVDKAYERFFKAR